MYHVSVCAPTHLDEKIRKVLFTGIARGSCVRARNTARELVFRK